MNGGGAARHTWFALALGGAMLLVSVLSSGIGRDERFLPVMLLLVLVVLVPLACTPPTSTRPRSVPGADILAPGTVVAVWYIVYIVIPAAYVVFGLDLAPNWVHPETPPRSLVVRTLLVAVVGLVAFGLGYRLPRPGRRWAPPGLGEEGVDGRSRLIPIAIILLAVGSIFKIAHLRAVGGASGDLFANLSATLSEELQQRFGGLPFFLSTFFDAGVLLVGFRAVVTGRGRIPALLLILGGAMLAFVLGGKRSAVMPFLLFPVVWYHYLWRRIQVTEGLLLIAGGGILMAGLLFARSLAPTVSAGGIGAVRSLGTLVEAPVLYYLNSAELNEFDMTALAIQRREELLRRVGGPLRGAVKYNAEALTYVVPRTLWGGKPVPEELGQVFYQDVVSGPSTVGFGVGILGALYLFWGPLGVMIGMGLLGVGFRAGYTALRVTERHVPSAYYYAFIFWDLFLFLRFGTTGFVVLLVIHQLPGLLAMLFATMRPPGAPERVRVGSTPNGGVA